MAKKKRRLSEKQKRNRAKSRRESKQRELYGSKIKNINHILEEYSSVLGKTSSEYSNMVNNIEKILGDEFSIFLNHGSDNKSARLSKYMKNVKTRKGKIRITKIYKSVMSSESAYDVAKNVYGVSNFDKDSVKKLKALTALKKLQNDTMPNYYESLDSLTVRQSMKFRKQFSQLKGLKKNSKEFAETYEAIGKDIMDFLEEYGNAGKEQLKRLEDEKSIFDETSSKTLSELLRRN